MTKPIPMILHCPSCGERHVDEGEWAHRSHHTHACQHCGIVWRPAIEPTVGVQFLPGFKNNPWPDDLNVWQPSVLDMLKVIEDSKCIYSINYRNAGVGMSFYNPPEGYKQDADWRRYIHTRAYHPSFEDCVRAEYIRLQNDEAFDED